jgi:C1A family cysteine protease
MLFTSTLSLLGLVVTLLLAPSAIAQDECSAQGIANCALENRFCEVSNDEAGECGACLEGFIEWERRNLCLDIENALNFTEYFNEWLETYEPFYKEDDADGATQVSVEDRLALLKATALYISTFYAENRGSTPSFELGLTAFSADTPEEEQQRAGYFYVNTTGTDDDLPRTPVVVQASSAAPEELPEKIDWVKEGAVTSVKDQGRCGCCWGVSLAGAVEGAAYVNKKYLQSVSFQQYISCNERNLGCDGGNLVIALGYTWLNDFEGMTRLNDYEYSDYGGTTTEECKLDEEKTPLAVRVEEPRIVLDFGAPFDFDERLRIMKETLAKQPISMVIRSSCKTLSNYRNGILTDDGDCACSASSCTDHAILMVGYDDTSDPTYFKFKNSWGDSWGEDGYFRVAQTEKGSYGLFAILAHGVVPDIAYNVTVQVKDDKQDTPLEPWAWVLIILACVMACCCCVGVLKKMKDGREEAGAPEEEK